MRPLKTLAMIMAGGKGERLIPLTAVRTKPAVPFGGKYRIVDFVLSNFLNSGITAMYVLVQYRSQSLIEHLREAWQIGGRITHDFVTVVPPQMRARGGWYEGTADAVYHNLNLIEDFRPDLVAIFGADHIYRMDISQMIDFHQERGAEVTVAALPVPADQASQFGIIEVDRYDRMIGFQEKPQQPKPMPDESGRALSSMGNYLFNTSLLLPILERDASQPGTHDFGRNIIPDMIGHREIFAYNCLRNVVPNLRSYEERGYWRDVGTLEAYWQANMDLLGETPLLDLRNDAWPILSGTYDGPMASLSRSTVENSMIGEGSHIVESEICRSIVGRGVRIEAGARLEECVIMDGVHIGGKARLRRVIADRFSSVPAGSEIGYHATLDPQGLHVSKSGLVVVPRDVRVADGLSRHV